MAKNSNKAPYDLGDCAPVNACVDISKDAVIGKDLKGHPTVIDDAIGERLAAYGVAAKVDEGWVRGHKWHNVYGG